jgi:hypothetical protein
MALFDADIFAQIFQEGRGADICISLPAAIFSNCVSVF